MLVNRVFSKQQAIVTYSITELLDMMKLGDLNVRTINQAQVRALKKYVFENMPTNEIYFPPIVAYIEQGTLKDERPMKLNVIDGTQRVMALVQMEEMIFKAIRSENETEVKTGYLLLHQLDEVKIAVQVFSGLSASEADQLYIDLNTKGKKVAISKRIAFDSRDGVNQITNYIMNSNELLKQAGVETEKRSINRPNNKKLLSLSQLRQLVGIFLTGKIVDRVPEIPKDAQLNPEECIELLQIWLNELFKLYSPQSIGNYEESMLASFPLLKSVAIYASRQLDHEPMEKKKELVRNRMKALKKINWRRENPVWKEFRGSIKGKEYYYFLDSDIQNIKMITQWLEAQGR